MKMSGKHQKAHNAFLNLSRPFSPPKIYEALCKLIGLKEEAIERGLGKLFREGKLKSEEKAPRVAKPSRGQRGEDDFR